MASLVRQAAVFQAHEHYVMSVRFMPEKPILVTAGMDNAIKLWGVPNWSLLMVLHGHDNSVNAVDFPADDNYLLSVSSDRSLRQ